MVPTYAILGGGKSILCLDCGTTSYHPEDVSNRYCGNCHEFHDDKEMVKRINEHNAAELKARIADYFDKTPAEEVVANAEKIARECCDD